MKYLDDAQQMLRELTVKNMNNSLLKNESSAKQQEAALSSSTNIIIEYISEQALRDYSTKIEQLQSELHSLNLTMQYRREKEQQQQQQAATAQLQQQPASKLTRRNVNNVAAAHRKFRLAPSGNVSGSGSSSKNDSFYIRKKMQSELQALLNVNNNNYGNNEKSKSNNNKALDNDNELREEEERQGKITEDLTHITSELKQRAQGIRDSIRDDVNMLDSKTGLVGQNVANVKSADKELKKHHSSATWNLCTRLGLIGIVIVTFFFMILVIRLFPKRW